MDKLKIGTCWLDGCSGCHMSLLDIDEGIVAVLKKADIVFGPLVDAQEWPEDVDVAVVEGAVIARTTSSSPRPSVPAAGWWWRSATAR